MTAFVRGISVDGRGASVNQEAIHEYTVTYKVYTDDRSDGGSVVESAFGIPKIGDMYTAGNDFDPYAVCISKSVRQGDSPWDWEVDVTYSNAPINIVGVPGNPVVDNPLYAAAEITYGFQNRTRLIPGRYNNPDSAPSDHLMELGIFAPNYELFNPQPEMEISEPVVTIKRNVATIDGPTLMGLANCVNSDYWWGAEPRQLKLSAPQASRKYHSVPGFYWEVSYAIAFRWETWDVQLLNQGTFYWSGGSPADPWNTTQAREVKRDASGNVLVVNLTTNGDINTTSTPTFTRLRVFREIPFATLGLI